MVYGKAFPSSKTAAWFVVPCVNSSVRKWYLALINKPAMLARGIFSHPQGSRSEHLQGASGHCIEIARGAQKLVGGCANIGRSPGFHSRFDPCRECRQFAVRWQRHRFRTITLEEEFMPRLVAWSGVREHRRAILTRRLLRAGLDFCPSLLRRCGNLRPDRW